MAAMSPFGSLFLIPFVRPLVTLLLGVVLSLACLVFVVIGSFRDNFLSSDFYVDNLAENDVYNRIYDEVLLDEQFADTTEDLLAGMKVPQEDIVGLSKRIIPPDYIQDQVEGAVTGAIDYLNKDADDPQLFIDMRTPVDRIKPTLLEYVAQRVDGLPEREVRSTSELERELKSIFRLLEDGEIADLTRIPAIADSPTPVDTDAAYDGAVRAFRRDPGFSRRALAGLEEHRGEIEAHLEAGRTREAVKVSAPPLTEPLMDEAVVDFRKDLDDRLRLDLVQKAAEQNGETREELLSRMDVAREGVARIWVGQWMTMLVIVAAGLLMALAHVPRMASALRYPGAALCSAGIGVLLAGLIARFGLLRGPLVREGSGAVPPTLVDAANDVFASMAADVGAGFIDSAVIFLVVGAGFVAASFLVGLLNIPFLSK